MKPDKSNPGWVASEEQLLSHILIDDGYARLLSDRAGPAFFRGFIVRNRTTGELSLKFRFKYGDDKRCWYQFRSTSQGAAGVEELKSIISRVLLCAASGTGTPLPATAVKFFDPPDDGGDGWRTIEWLRERDLIEVVAIQSHGAALQEPATEVKGEKDDSNACWTTCAACVIEAALAKPPRGTRANCEDCPKARS